jgi:hypothetical protein
MIHFISDEALGETLRRVRGRMRDGARLIVRTNVPPAGGGTWKWKWAVMSRKVRGARVWMRPVEQVAGAISAAGFSVERKEMSGGNAESWWVVAVTS